MGSPLDDLENELASRPDHILIVAGAGVTCAAATSPCVSWTGLLRNGFERCRQRCPNLDEDWRKITELMTNSSSAGELVQAASRIEEALRKNHDGEYGKWLSDSIGSIRLVDRRTIDALLNWDVRIATTNYDNLFEEASDLRAINWTQGDLALKVLRGDEPGILHLHGHYMASDTVVFGTRTYEDVCRDIGAQNLLRSVLTRDTVVFVGCGAGVDDPNFAGLLEWSREALKTCQHTHYHLVRDAELKSVSQQYEGLSVTPVPYGAEYSNLGPFLEGIAKRVKLQRKNPSQLEVLNSGQTDYEQRRRELASEGGLPAQQFVRRNFEIARELWGFGGRRTAALRMYSTLNNNTTGHELTNEERVKFTLEAVDHLLDDGLNFHATDLATKIGPLMSQVAEDPATLSRFRCLLTRCLNASAKFEELMNAIQTGLSVVSGDERSRLEAERAELHLLCGNLRQAEEDLRLEDR